MRPSLRDETYVFVTLAAGEPLPPGVEPLMTFRENEGLTLIVTPEEAAAAGLAGAFACRMITLGVHSSLQAIGLLASVAGCLAAAGISANAVSAFHHDHLFVPAGRAEEAVLILERLAQD